MRKLFSFFAITAVVLGMASCNGNEPSQKAFAFRLVRYGDMAAEVCVTPTNMQALYIIGYATKERVWKDEYLTSYLEEFRLAGHTYQELVDKNEIRSGIRYIEDTNLEPGTEYIFYACQVDEALKIVNLEFEHVKTLPAGQLSGEFSVSADKKVRFSKGNLRKKLVGAYYFAENQWDAVGQENQTGTATYYDLLPWGVSEPGDTSYVDFGTKPIVNGGNEANQWRTLTADEWKYLIDHAKVGYGAIAGVEGLILVPSEVDDVELKEKDNFFTQKEWWEMEVLGAVFLPLTGYKEMSSIVTDLDEGYYWSSTLDTNKGSEDRSTWKLKYLHIDNGLDCGGDIRNCFWTDYNPFGDYCMFRCAVRLVQDVK